ncbi:MAG TPA: M28 family peptidase [Solirubrobacteraceae bacterium]|nr:M28 family peptidase [Solirubrobacteraceae bacterium]
MGLVPVVLAVIVLAFSLTGQQGALSSSLAPDAYSGAAAAATLNHMATNYPHRLPGSPGDTGLAGYVATQLHDAGFNVSTTDFNGRTAIGTRQLENVVGIRAGQENGSIVIVSHRDALGSPAKAELSGTASMLELASVLQGETLQHTVIMASTSGSAGAAGAAALARSLPQPVDAVIVLGDMAGTTVREPIVVPWSNTQQVAPPVLRNTVASALSAQAGLPAGSSSLLAQLAHLALPMAATEQAPFNSSGEPAVLLSLSGEQTPSASEPVSPVQLTTTGRTLLQSVNALDTGGTVAAPSSYLSFSGKAIPAWAVRLLSLALILPVLMATIDGFARARRRGSWVLRWLIWVLAAALPFVLAVLLVLFARAVGWISAAPPGPLDGSAINLTAGNLALLAVVAALIVAGLLWLRRGVIALTALSGQTRPGADYGPGAAAAVLLLLCAVDLALWFSNPFAALLLAPALHLWLWIVVPEVRLPAPATAVLLLAGLTLPVLVVVEYATSLGHGPLTAAWSWMLLLAGGGIGFATAIVWSVFLGCVVSVIAIAVRAAGADRPQPQPVTVRGPVTYAGPGSLGGTESALHR